MDRLTWRPTGQGGASERGAALLIVVVVIAVLTVAGFALLKMGSSENEAVASKRHYDRAVSCADAAKEMLLSQFRTYGLSPLDIQVDKVVGDQRAGTGHYDQIGQPSVRLAEGFKKSSFGASDISNRIVMSSELGGQYYRMTVVCSDSSDATHQSEVEFVVRFGL